MFAEAHRDELREAQSLEEAYERLYVAHVAVLKLNRPEHAGDWHDPLIRWGVYGPGTECQKFSTKREAQRYASTRRHADTQGEAIHIYLIHG